jgi:K+-sensing histidine kinase KdpD
MRRRNWPRSIAFVIISVVVATVMTFPLRHVAPHTQGLFFIASVMLVTMYEGTAFGIVSALLSTLLADWFFDQRPYHFDLDLAALVRAIAFCSFAALVGWLEKQRHTALDSLRDTNQNLRRALDEVKTLSGILPICMYCKQIKTEDGNWMLLENYMRAHTEAEFSHGLCPECYKKYYPDVSAASPL